MTDTDVDADYLRRTGVTDLVWKLVRAEHGPGAMVQRDISPQLRIPEWVPADWRQGIAAARAIAWQANQDVAHYARQARGDGLTWLELAEAILGDTSEDNDPAWLAFERIAGGPTGYPFGDRAKVCWDCSTCQGEVVDFGPTGDHPADQETGHTDDCARHAEAITVYRERHGL